jgi:hypothetical protein
MTILTLSAAYFLMPDKKDFEASGALSSFQHQGTGSMVTRHFCPTCGS